MSDYDIRQYQLMSEELQLFATDRISLSRLVSTLEALLLVLQERDQGWISLFRKEWGKLEIELAFACDNENQSLGRTAVRRINLAVAALSDLVNSKQANA